MRNASPSRVPHCTYIFPWSDVAAVKVGDAERAFFVRRIMNLFGDRHQPSDIVPGKVCRSCGCPLFFKLCASGPHYAELRCVECGIHNGFLPKPDADKIRRPAGHRELVQKYGRGFCEMCLTKDSDLTKNETLTGHHVVEFADGGSSERENIWIICTACHAMLHWLRTYRMRHGK